MMKSIRILTVLIMCSAFVLNVNAMNTISSSGDSSTTEQSKLNKTRVIDRLVEVGYSKEEAIARVDKMTCDEVEYLAEHPESIKRTGFVILASLIGSSIYSSMENTKKKKEAYIKHLQDKIGAFRLEITLLDSKRMNQRTLAMVEQDPEKKAALEAEAARIGKEIDSKQDNIQKLENEISAINAETSKKEVPESKEFDKRINEILEQETTQETTAKPKTFVPSGGNVKQDHPIQK